MIGKILCAVGLHKWPRIVEVDIFRHLSQECQRCHIDRNGRYPPWWKTQSRDTSEERKSQNGNS